ncbi:MAG: glycosyltransferase, partial [Candidatus Delongbacteria bacterium]|nr:glycosyltransferase [Candidatus Delongbacteria bacterium]
VLEAMNLGCIPVVTKVGALPELVKNAEYHCDYGDVGSTKSAIQQAINSENQDEIMNLVKEKFSLQQRGKKLIELIKQEL